MDNITKAQIQEAIRTRVTNGLNYEQIESEFINAGYTKEQIQAFYSEVTNTAQQADPVLSTNNNLQGESVPKQKSKLRKFFKYLSIFIGLIFILIIVLGIFGGKSALVTSAMNDVRGAVPGYLEKNDGKLNGFCEEATVSEALKTIDENTGDFACEANEKSILIQYTLDDKQVLCKSAMIPSKTARQPIPAEIACVTTPINLGKVKLSENRGKGDSIFQPAFANGKTDWNELQAKQFPKETLSSKSSASGGNELKYKVLENDKHDIEIPDMYGDSFGFSSGRLPNVSVSMIGGGVDPCSSDNVDKFVSSSGQSACYDLRRYSVFKLLPEQFTDSESFGSVDKNINAVHEDKALFLVTEGGFGASGDERVQKVYLDDEVIFELPKQDGDIVDLFSASDKSGWIVEKSNPRTLEIYWGNEKETVPTGVYRKSNSGFENGIGYVSLNAKEGNSNLVYVMTFMGGGTDLYGPFSRGADGYQISKSGVSFFGRDEQVTKIYMDNKLSEEINGAIDWGVFSKENDFTYSMNKVVYHQGTSFDLPESGPASWYKPHYIGGKLYIGGLGKKYYVEGEWFDFSESVNSSLYVIDGYPLVVSVEDRGGNGYVNVAYFLDGSPWQEDLVRSINILNSL